MVEKRDIELSIRAKDLSSADLKRVSAAVQNITDGLEKQAVAASKGGVSLGELRNTLTELKQAGEALANQQGLIDTYTKLGGAIAKTENELEQAKAKLAAFNAEAAKGGALTEKQAQRQKNLADSLTSASRKAQEAQDRFKAFNDSLKAGEALTERQAARQAKLAESVTKTGKAADEARDRLDKFNKDTAAGNVERAAAQQATLQKAVNSLTTSLTNQQSTLAKTGAAMDAAGLDARDLATSQKQIALTAGQVGAASTTVSTTIAAYAKNQRELTAATKADTDAQKASAAAADTRKRVIEQALSTVAEKARKQERLIQAVRAAEAGADREASVAAKAEAERNAKAIADQQALAAAAERSALSFRALATAQKGTTSTSALDAVTGAAGARGAAAVQRQTLGGLESVAGNASQLANDVEKARGPVKNFNLAIIEMERTIARANAVAKQIDGFRTQANAVGRTEEAFHKAQEQLKFYADQVRNAGGKATPAMIDALNNARDSVRNLGAQLVEQNAKLRNLQQNLTEAGVDTRNLARDQDRLVKIVRDSTKSIQQFTTAMKARGVTEGDNLGILGLRPYEIQNLSYQVNDFFTQISSGTSITQAFAQQIGQVVQIGRIGPMLLAAAPYVVGFVAVIGTAVAALTRLNSSFTTLRQASTQQILGGGVDPARVLAAARAAERVGVSFSDAREAALAFARLPIPAAQYEQLVVTAGRLGVAWGDNKRALEELREAFNSGTRGILELDDKYRFLTDTQRAFIREARTQNELVNAQRTAIEALAAQATTARAAALNPLREAFNDLRIAWRLFLDSLATDAVIKSLTTAVRGLASALGDLADGLADIGPLLPILATVAGGIGGGLVGGPGGAFLGGAAGLSAALAIAAARGRRLQANGGGGATPPAPSAPGGTDVEDDADFQRQYQERQRQEEQNRARAAEEGRRRIAQLETESRLEERIRKGTAARATDAERLDAITAAGEKRLREFVRENANADQESRNRARELGEQEQRNAQAEAARSQAGAARTELRRELSEIESDVRALESLRNDQVREINEQVQAGALDAVTAMQRLDGISAQLRPRFAALADEAKRFADANRGRDGLSAARADALVARTGRLAEGGGEQGPASTLLRQSSGDLQKAVQERSTLIQSINALEQQGAITSFDAQQRIRDAYLGTNDSITAQITALENLVIAQEASGRISATAAANTRAQIELARAQLVYVNPQITAVRQAFEQTASAATVQGFNDIAEAIGGIVNGTKTWVDVLRAARNAALNLFASVLKGIAETIIKQQILNALQAIYRALGGPPSGGGGLPIPGLGGPGGIGSARLGGTVGANGLRNNAAKRRVNPAWFANAPHYRNGGFPKLRPDEEAAVLHRGEEVLTKDDPRNMLNWGKGGPGGGGGGGGAEVGIRNVLVMDPAAIPEALAGADGERVLINFIKKNSATIRQIVR